MNCRRDKCQVWPKNEYLFLTNKYRKNVYTMANDRVNREKPGDTTENADRSQGVRSRGNRPSGLAVVSL